MMLGREQARRPRSGRFFPMKITGVETIYLRQKQVKKQCDSGQDALIVKVTTDAGITGIGEVDSSPLAVKGMIEGPFSHTTTTGLREVVLGEDPFETEYLWHKMYRANIYAGRRGIGIHAMSGIDMALWDIKGKALRLPIWKLLGGGFHQKLRCYASTLFGSTPKKTFELRSEEHTSELQSQSNLVCRLLLEKKKKKYIEISVIVNNTHSQIYI